MDDAAVVGRLLIEDFSHLRRHSQKPGNNLLVVDEFGALGTVPPQW
jgi:hypothetical protein